MEQRIQTVCLLVLAGLAAGGVLYWLRPVMIPFVLAVFVALGLSSIMEFQMRRLRLPRPLSVLSTLLLALLLFTLLGSLVSVSVGQLSANAEIYQEQFGRLLDRAAAALPSESVPWSRERLLEPLTDIPASSVGGMLVATTNAIVNTLSQGLLVLIFVLYLLIGLGKRARAPAGVWAEVEARINRYLVTKAVISAATGVLVGLTLFLLGVDLALVFGLFAFLLNFIPSIGSIIATLLPLPVVVFDPEISLTVAVLAIAIPGAIQLTIGNFLEPMVMGDSLDLHPVTILIALIVWGMLWGVVGMLLATPITAVMKILFERLEPTRPLAALMAGRLPGGGPAR